MDTKDMVKVRAEQTVEHMLDKIDRVLDDARDEGDMTETDVDIVLKCWKAILKSKEACRLINS